MATFNGELFLREQLESISNQTVLPVELVVCDDGSTDRTVSILEDFRNQTTFPVRIYRNPKRLGSTLNFEQAIKFCSGEVILLADQDDLWLPDRIERSTELFVDHPECGYVFSDAQCIDAIGNGLSQHLWNSFGFNTRRRANFCNPTLQVYELLLGNFVTGATLGFRSKFRNLFIPISKHSCLQHDYWIALSLSAAGYYGISSISPFIQYRLHNTQQIGVPKKNSKWRRRMFGNFNDPSPALHIELELMEELRHHSRISMQAFMANVGDHYFRTRERLEVLEEDNRLLRAYRVARRWWRGQYTMQKWPILSALKDIMTR